MSEKFHYDRSRNERSLGNRKSDNNKKEELEVRGRARREAARRRKSEWKVNLGTVIEIPLTAMAAGE